MNVFKYYVEYVLVKKKDTAFYYNIFFKVVDQNIILNVCVDNHSLLHYEL